MLLSHPTDTVRARAYRRCLLAIKGSLGIHNVMRPFSMTCRLILFLLENHLLYEVFAFGIQDAYNEVAAAAREIVVTLYRSRMIMADSTWRVFIEATVPVVPVLQSYVCEDGELGNCILDLSAFERSEESQEDGQVLPPTEHLRASMRLLLTGKLTIRAVGCHQLFRHLVAEPDAAGKRPSDLEVVLAAASDIFLVRQPVPPDTPVHCSGVIKNDAVRQVHVVFISNAVDMTVRKSAAEQLAIMMMDSRLHVVLRDLGIVEEVLTVLHGVVKKDGEVLDTMCLPCLTLLRRLLYKDLSLRRELAHRSSQLFTLLRVALIFRLDVAIREEVAVLITLLLFEEVALQPDWCEDLPAQSWALYSLPWVIVDRFCLPFMSSTHYLVSPNRTAGPSVNDPLTLPHIVASLRLSWHLAWHEDVKNLLRCDISTSNKCLPPILHLTSADLRALAVCCPFAGLRSSLDQLSTASTHREAHAVLASLHVRLLSDHLLPSHSCSPYTDALLELPFIEVLQRFVLVRPANRADGVVLADVLHMLASLIHAQGDAPEPSFVLHLLNLMEQDGCPLLDLLCGFERGGVESVSLVPHRAVLELYGVLLDSITCTSHRECSLALRPVRGKLVDTLLERLREAESQSFYDLPSLEAILLALVHAAAVPGWSVHSARFALPRDLHLGLLSALQEVILSFSIGREGNCTSFLGKGVTRSALQCLYQLAHEMRSEADGDDWVELWCSPHHIGTGSNPPGLTWLLTLWVDRDPEVRVSSLAIAAVLTTTEAGCRALLIACRGIPGGLWGTALNILLDHAECSLVRCQVAFILQNLLAIPRPCLTDDVQDDLWQDPCVHDDQLDISLVGQPALLALLVHCNFYSFLTLTLSSVYLDAHLADRPAASNVITGSGALDSACIAALDGEEARLPLKDTHSDNSTSSTWLSSLSTETNDATTPQTEEMQHRNISYPTNRLSAQGQSDSEPGVRPSNGIRDLHRESSKTDGQAVVTAALAAAFCNLVGNIMAIAPDETTVALESYGVFGALVRCCDKQALQSSLQDLQNVPLGVPRRRRLKAQVQGWLELFCSLCTLWRTCATLCPTHFLRVHSLRDICDVIFSGLVLTSMPGTPCNVEDMTRASWVHGLDLLSTLAHVHEPDLLKTFISVPGECWEGFLRCLELCLKDTSQVEAVTAALHCLSAMLVAEGKLVLKGRSVAEISELGSFSLSSLLERGTTISELPGFRLCKLLMERYQHHGSAFAAVDSDTCTTLCLLLSVSPSAKQAALQAGLIVKSIDHLNKLHDRLNIAPRKASNGKKDNPVMKEVRNILTLLRNCLYDSEEMKLAAIQESTLPTLLSLWPWLLTCVDVLHAALHFLCVLTANCPSACTACCSVVHSRTPTCQSGARGSSTAGLFQHLVRICSQSRNNSQHLAFNVLSNLSLCQEARSMLQKGNFLNQFAKVPLPRLGQAPHPTLQCWLWLLVMLSYSEDGRQLVLRASGSLDVLLDLEERLKPSKDCVAGKHSLKRVPLPQIATLILHNLCFCQAAKAHILASERYISLLIRWLDSDECTQRTAGASALWALLHHSQKAKVSIKNPRMKAKVDSALLAAKNEAHAEQSSLEEHFFRSLKNISALLNS